MVESHLIQIEPDERLVVLARTMHVQDALSEMMLKNGVGYRASFGEAYLGWGLYQHGSIFQGGSDVSPWSHLELSYFRDVIPKDVINNLVLEQKSEDIRLLRAEILLTTPAAFVVPQGRKSLADRPGRQVSLEYIDVRPAYLGEYRNIMRRYIGPAAAKLVGSGKFGTFRAMETTAVLYQDPSLNTDWNQIHLCEVEIDSFKGFGQEFDAALREISPDGGFAAIFAGLGQMRTIPRWTFNDAVVEADFAIGQLGTAKPPL